VKRVGAYEAKTNLGRLLEEVAAGETITITKHGVPVAVLAPPGPDRARTHAAAAGLRAFRATHRLAGATIRELIEEGRRR
jgi:prevent-host-death family protein